MSQDSQARKVAWLDIKISALTKRKTGIGPESGDNEVRA
jgi:hypothetical protein